MQTKIRTALLCGGKSAEHEISLISAKNIAAAIDKNSHEISLVGVSKEGRWFKPGRNGGFFLHEDDPKSICLNEKSLDHILDELQFLKNNFDVVFPVLHGPFGEDGTIQGLLEIAGVPYIGARTLGAACGMDKDIAKRLLRDAGIPVADWILLEKNAKTPPFSEISAKLGLPLFIKPSNMGSSVGVHKVYNENEWKNALDDAFLYDNLVLAEKFIEGHEIECAVLEENGEAHASILGKIIPKHDFYSYNAKYIDENGASFEIPAKLPPDIAKKTAELALKTFRALRARSLARVDFFVKDSGEIFVNEINTMPGFTKISMYPKLWEQSGVSYTELISKLIRSAAAVSTGS